MDPSARAILFSNLWLHADWSLPRFRRAWACPFDDVLWAQLLPAWSYGPDWLVIQTTHGRIILASYNPALRDLHESLHAIAREKNPPRLRSGNTPGIVAAIIVAIALIIAFAKGWLP